MEKFDFSVVNVVGNSIESCLFSNYLKNKFPEKSIRHFRSGNLGGVHSFENGLPRFFTLEQKNKILNILPDVEFQTITETYLKIPYNKLEFQNSNDGYIRFPLTKKSFECEFDYNDIVDSTPTLQDFMDSYSSTKNVIKCLKGVFNHKFFNNVIKRVSLNYLTIPQANIDPRYTYNTLLQLDSLADEDYYCYHYPTIGVEELCNRLLSGIEVKLESKANIKKLVKNNKNLNYICENYDYYFDLMHGPLDYLTISSDIHKKYSMNLDEIVRIYTPYDKKSGLYYEVNSTIYKTTLGVTRIKSNNFGEMLLAPTIDNSKKILDYQKTSNLIPNIKLVS